MNRNDPPENASYISAIEGKCLIIHIVKFRFNTFLVYLPFVPLKQDIAWSVAFSSASFPDVGVIDY